MVPIYGVPIPRSPTVQTNVDLSIHAQGEDLVISSSLTLFFVLTMLKAPLCFHQALGAFKLVGLAALIDERFAALSCHDLTRWVSKPRHQVTWAASIEILDQTEVR